MHDPKDPTPRLVIGGKLPEGKTLQGLAAMICNILSMDDEDLTNQVAEMEAAAREGRPATIYIPEDDSDAARHLAEGLTDDLRNGSFTELGLWLRYTKWQNQDDRGDCFMLYVLEPGERRGEFWEFSDDRLQYVTLDLDLSSGVEKGLDRAHAVITGAIAARDYLPPALVASMPKPKDEDAEDTMLVAYCCPACGHEWEAEQESAHDNDCPTCELRAVTPYWHGYASLGEDPGPALEALRKQRRTTYHRIEASLAQAQNLLKKVEEFDDLDEVARTKTVEQIEHLLETM